MRCAPSLRWSFLVAALCIASPGFAENSAAVPSPTLDRVKARQALYVGYRETAVPFSYLLPGKTAPVGYVWDVCTHVFKAVEARLGQAIPLVPISVTDNTRAMMLKTGVVDLDCGAAANMVSRLDQVGFSTNLYVSRIGVLVGKDAGFSHFPELAGKKVVTVAGDAGERYLKMAALDHSITLKYLSANNPAEAISMLEKKEADAYVAEDAELVSLRAVAPGKFVLLDESLGDEPFAIMLPKDDAGWKSLVDETVVGLMRSGELARIYDKWFMNPIPPANINLNLPMSKSLQSAIENPNDTAVN